MTLSYIALKFNLGSIERFSDLRMTHGDVPGAFTVRFVVTWEAFAGHNA